MKQRTKSKTRNELFSSPGIPGEGGVRVLSQRHAACPIAKNPHPTLSRRTGRGNNRRGMIFITSLGIIIVLVSLLLVFAQSMRTEALASANQLAAIQAETIEHGAEQWASAQVDANSPNATTITQISADTIPVGGGYFWVMRANPDNTTTQEFGITDESSKLNIGVARLTRTINLPGMTEQATDSIGDWVDTNETPNPAGAESSYYNTLPEAYSAKNAALESPEELLLIQGVDENLLYGYDRNHNGVIDNGESATNSGTSSVIGSGDASCGIFPCITVFTVEPNTASDGSQRFYVGTAIPQFYGGINNLLTQAKVPASDITQIMNRLLAALAGKPSGSPAFQTLGSFYTAAHMNSNDLVLVADKLTSSRSSTLLGMVNVNTASAAVLATLPGLTETDADTLINARGSATHTDFAWALSALAPAQAESIAGSLTARSYQYSADIVAVSPGGRAFKRVRIVIDARTVPSKIIYRKDLTALGWPLNPAIQKQLRAGQTPVAGAINQGDN